MIDRDVFADEFGLLDKHFPGERSVEETRRYYRVLSERMDTREFTSACERLFIEREHFPRPKDFLEAVGESSDHRARRLWPKVRKVAGAYSRYPRFGEDGERYYRHRRMMEDLPADVQEAVRRLGGVGHIAHATDDERPHLRRKFIQLMEDVSREVQRRELPPGEEQQNLEPEDDRAEDLLEEATGAVSLPGDSS